MDTIDNWKKAKLVASGVPLEDAIKESKIEVTAFTKPNCPRCGTLMASVTLCNVKRKAYFCNVDNVTVPLPIKE